MVWKPDVTVAAVIERDGRYLIVEEHTLNGIGYNQPAGHLEPGESLVDAVIRETREETAWTFMPEALVGVYHWRHPQRDLTYLRFTFCGQVTNCDALARLDDGIIAAHWMTLDEIRAVSARHRSPMVLRNIEDYQRGQRYPLGMLHHLESQIVTA